jgi:hypothetical protein
MRFKTASKMLKAFGVFDRVRENADIVRMDLAR